MQTITWAPEIVTLLPTLRIGLVETIDVTVTAHNPALWTMLEELCERLRGEFKGKVAADRAEIAATRRAYRAVGDDPTRYRAANEALLRRVLRRSSVPRINTVVDLNNFVSLESGWALGSYDVAQLHGPITVRCGADDESYPPIGKEAVNAARRLVLADQVGIFGSPTADAQRSMVTEATRHVLFVIWAFEADNAVVGRVVDRTAQLLTMFCGGTTVDQRVVAPA